MYFTPLTCYIWMVFGVIFMILGIALPLVFSTVIGIVLFLVGLCKGLDYA